MVSTLIQISNGSSGERCLVGTAMMDMHGAQRCVGVLAIQDIARNILLEIYNVDIAKSETHGAAGHEKAV